MAAGTTEDLLVLGECVIEVVDVDVEAVPPEQPDTEEDGDVAAVECEEDADEECECEDEDAFELAEAVETVDLERVAVTVGFGIAASNPPFQLLTGFLEGGSSRMVARTLLNLRNDDRFLSLVAFSGISSPFDWSPSTNQDPTTPHQPMYAASRSDSMAANALDTPLGVGLFSIFSTSDALAWTSTAA